MSAVSVFNMRVTMSVDPGICKLAADPEVLFAVETVEVFFKSMVKGKDEAEAQSQLATAQTRLVSTL